MDFIIDMSPKTQNTTFWVLSHCAKYARFLNRCPELSDKWFCLWIDQKFWRLIESVGSGQKKNVYFLVFFYFCSLWKKTPGFDRQKKNVCPLQGRAKVKVLDQTTFCTAFRKIIVIKEILIWKQTKNVTNVQLTLES